MLYKENSLIYTKMNILIPAKTKIKCQSPSCINFVVLSKNYNNINDIKCPFCSIHYKYSDIPEIGCFTYCRKCLAYFQNYHSDFDKCYNCRKN